MNPSAGVEVQLCLLCQPVIDEGHAHASRAFFFLAFHATHVQLQRPSPSEEKEKKASMCSRSLMRVSLVPEISESS